MSEVLLKNCAQNPPHYPTFPSESESCADSTNSTGTGISSECESCGDSSQTISSGDREESIEGGN